MSVLKITLFALGASATVLPRHFGNDEPAQLDVLGFPIAAANDHGRVQGSSETDGAATFNTRQLGEDDLPFEGDFGRHTDDQPAELDVLGFPVATANDRGRVHGSSETDGAATFNTRQLGEDALPFEGDFGRHDDSQPAELDVLGFPIVSATDAGRGVGNSPLRDADGTFERRQLGEDFAPLADGSFGDDGFVNDDEPANVNLLGLASVSGSSHDAARGGATFKARQLGEEDLPFVGGSESDDEGIPALIGLTGASDAVNPDAANVNLLGLAGASGSSAHESSEGSVRGKLSSRQLGDEDLPFVGESGLDSEDVPALVGLTGASDDVNPDAANVNILGLAGASGSSAHESSEGSVRGKLNSRQLGDEDLPFVGESGLDSEDVPALVGLTGASDDVNPDAANVNILGLAGASGASVHDSSEGTTRGRLNSRQLEQLGQLDGVLPQHLPNLPTTLSTSVTVPTLIIPTATITSAIPKVTEACAAVPSAANGIVGGVTGGLTSGSGFGSIIKRQLQSLSTIPIIGPLLGQSDVADDVPVASVATPCVRVPEVTTVTVNDFPTDIPFPTVIAVPSDVAPFVERR